MFHSLTLVQRRKRQLKSGVPLILKLSENWAVKIIALLDTGNSTSQTLMRENITGGILNLPLL